MWFPLYTGVSGLDISIALVGDAQFLCGTIILQLSKLIIVSKRSFFKKKSD